VNFSFSVLSIIGSSISQPPADSTPAKAAMLRLKTHLLSALCAASSLPAASSLLRGRLLSGRSLVSAAPRSAARFVPDVYLVARCGLTPEQAWEASKHLTSLKSPSNPDAVRNFLGRLGLSDSAASTAIARHPQILCSKVDETLARRVAELRKIGISPGEISHLVTVYPKIILSRIQVSRLAFYFSLMGSCERRVRALLENNTDLLEQSLGEVVKPNLAFLRKTFKCDVPGMAPWPVRSIWPRGYSLHPRSGSWLSWRAAKNAADQVTISSTTHSWRTSLCSRKNSCPRWSY
jgi:hypothetical protein